MVSSLVSIMTFSLLVSFYWMRWVWSSLTTGAEGQIVWQWHRWLAAFDFLAHDLSANPGNVLWFVAQQLVSDTGVLSDCSRRETTLREHQALIRRQYGYRDFSWPWPLRLSRLLFTHNWFSNERPGLLFDLTTSWLMQNKILLPGVTTPLHLVQKWGSGVAAYGWNTPTKQRVWNVSVFIESELTCLNICSRANKGHAGNFNKNKLTDNSHWSISQ